MIPLESPETPAPAPPQIPRGKTPLGERLEAPILIESQDWKRTRDSSRLRDEEVGSSDGDAHARCAERLIGRESRRAVEMHHHSQQRNQAGNARIFDTYHRRVRKMQNGLAYHFVIGNGSSSGNGEIEIGPRWTKQLNGGHVASDYLNNIAIGVCLVGDLNRDQPTKAQLGALDELITYLRDRVGKIKGRRRWSSRTRGSIRDRLIVRAIASPTVGCNGDSDRNYCMKVGITGVSGFIGSRVAARCGARGIEVVGFSRNPGAGARRLNSLPLRTSAVSMRSLTWRANRFSVFGRRKRSGVFTRAAFWEHGASWKLSPRRPATRCVGQCFCDRLLW